jgi:3-polyprenyl-4-hydroxybenzoate decarboxylase
VLAVTEHIGIVIPRMPAFHGKPVTLEDMDQTQYLFLIIRSSSPVPVNRT